MDLGKLACRLSRCLSAGFYYVGDRWFFVLTTIVGGLLRWLLLVFVIGVREFSCVQKFPSFVAACICATKRNIPFLVSTTGTSSYKHPTAHNSKHHTKWWRWWWWEPLPWDVLWLSRAVGHKFSNHLCYNVARSISLHSLAFRLFYAMHGIFEFGVISKKAFAY